VSWRGWAAIGGVVGVIALVQTTFSIDGQAVGGLSPDEARQKASVATHALADRSLTVTFEAEHWTATAADLGYGYDVDAAVTQAFAIGHDSPPWAGLAAQFTLMRQPADLDVRLIADNGRLAAWILDIAAQINRPLREANLSVAGSEVRVDPGQAGRRLDVAALQQAVDGWAASGVASAELPLPVTIQPLTRESAQLDSAAQQLRAVLSDTPVRLELDGQAWELPSASVRDALSWSLPAPPSTELNVSLDAAKLRPAIASLAKAVDRQPQDAQLAWSPAGVVAQKPSLDGRQLDVDATLAAIAQAVKQPARRAQLAVKTAPAKLSSANLSALGIKELVSEGKSNFSYSPYERIVNVKKMASLLNGVVLAPGEEFSFNKVMGDIDQSEGWAEGLVIMGGRTVPGLGGGICQVSTTTFRGAFWAGLPITERHDHDYPVPYYTQGGYAEGFDATVWSPDLDLKFRNDTPGYLLIQTTIDPARSNLTVSFYGTKVPNRDITMEGPFISNVRPAPPPRHILDPRKPAGYVSQTDSPHPGMHVVLRRVVQDASGSHTDEFVSDYTPWSTVYVEGPPKDLPPPPEDEAPPTDA
jgi:vancomycin resistance protein YoaR